MRWEIKHLLIVYFLSNISAKNYQSRFMCVKVTVTQSGDIFSATQCICRATYQIRIRCRRDSWPIFNNYGLSQYC